MDMKKSPVLSNRGSLVREGGVEPPRPHGHTDLNRARLPIPPLAHMSYGVSPQATHKTIRTARGAVQLRECDLHYLVVVGVTLGTREEPPSRYQPPSSEVATEACAPRSCSARSRSMRSMRARNNHVTGPTYGRHSTSRSHFSFCTSEKCGFR